MPKMKALLFLLILVLVVACSEQKAPQPAAAPATAPAAAPAAVADNEANRQVAAKQYLEAVPPQELLSQMSDSLVKMLPEKSQKVFLEVMNSKSMQEATYRITLNGLVKHFTVNELKALTAFYGSPEGKSISKKFPAYMEEAMPQINQEVLAALQKATGKEHPGGEDPHGQLKPAEPKGPHSPTMPAVPQAAPQPDQKPQAPQAQPPAPPAAK